MPSGVTVAENSIDLALTDFEPGDRIGHPWTSVRKFRTVRNLFVESSYLYSLIDTSARKDNLHSLFMTSEEGRPAQRRTWERSFARPRAGRDYPPRPKERSYGLPVFLRTRSG